jgi:hypothetical protein
MINPARGYSGLLKKAENGGPCPSSGIFSIKKLPGYR